MGTYILRRLLQMIPVVLGATFFIFMLVYALPGEPWEGRCGERPCSDAYIAKFKQDYNLDKPVLVQYGLYLGKLIHGDLGTNYYNNQVSDELLLRYPTTIKLALVALIVQLVVGIMAGVLAGVRRGSFIDSLVTISTLVVISIPIFVIGSLAQFTILTLGLNQTIPVTASAGTMSQLILPGVVLGSLSVAYVARLTRANLVENLRADYVRTAKAKGLSWGRTVGLHTLRNSLIPVITFIGYDVGQLMGGAVVTERIFNINGIGGFIFRSIDQLDGVSVVGAVTVLVLIYLLANLVVDVMYGVLDPRISHD
jgi:putative peptide ABC transporter, permease component